MLTDPCVVILGRIHTMLEDKPCVEAVCASKGRVLCMGDREEVLSFASARQYSVIDTEGGHIYPGFIDSHSHLSGYSGMIDDVFCGLSCGIKWVNDLVYRERKVCGILAEGLSGLPGGSRVVLGLV